MTTIAMTSVRSSGTTRLRLTVRGRRVLAAAAAFPAAAALALAVVGGSAAIATPDAGMPVGSFETVTVAAGESLWSIAQDIAPSADPRDVVSAIERLNALEGGTLTAGQKLSVPAEYAGGE